MKRLLSIFSLLAIAFYTFAITHTYTESSVLSSGSWVKIRVSESGVYRMTYEELQAAGLSNPANVRVYGYGGAMLTQNFNKVKIDDLPAVGFYMEKGADGVFGAGGGASGGGFHAETRETLDCLRRRRAQPDNGALFAPKIGSRNPARARNRLERRFSGSARLRLSGGAVVVRTADFVSGDDGRAAFDVRRRPARRSRSAER